MAVNEHRPLDEFQRLRQVAAQTRLRAICSQMALAITFCNIAESELALGHIEQPDKIVRRLQKMAATICRHLNEPNHVPPDEIPKVHADLARLESRIRALEERGRR